MDTEVTTLQKAALGKIVTSLGELARSIACRFCCGNTLSSPEHVNIVYEKSEKNWSSITFPGAEQADVQQLMGVCSVASFTISGEHEEDGHYHYACELRPNQFTTSFQLCNTSILSEIRKLMMPDMRGSIRAELYRLNIRSGPGGHFKAHVDTLRSSQMFGSLVVCLPIQFSGGALVTRHQGKEVRFDWSSSPQKPMQKVSWAAFFSDVEHEVLPVTDGYRLTLTYNLYCGDKLLNVTPTANITNSPFYHELCAAVSNPHFLRDGGVLGFSCQHDYVFEDLNHTEELPRLLKGADSIVYMAGMSLGLPVIVKPVTNHFESEEERLYCYVLPKFDKFFVDESGGVREGEYDEDRMIKWKFGTLVHYDTNIMWCQELTNFQPAFAYRDGVFDSEATCAAAYQAAAILVCVPKWGKRHILGIVPQERSDEENFEPSKKKSRLEEREEEEGQEKVEEEQKKVEGQEEEEEDSSDKEEDVWEKRKKAMARAKARAAAFGGTDMDQLLSCDSGHST